MKFLAILFVFALAHGVCFNAILRPQEISWNMLRDIVFQPYFNIYGELFFEDIGKLHVLFTIRIQFIRTFRLNLGKNLRF